MKFGNSTNSNMLNFHGDVHFFCYGPKILFLEKFGQQNQNCLFKIKLGAFGVC